MLKLCGISLSNYYNKVKFVLLEKNIEFEEVLVPAGADSIRSKSPLAKVPFIETEDGALCESQVIVDYIETRWPQPPLLPADAWGAAKVCELTTFLDLHLELVARRLYPRALWGRSLPVETVSETLATLENAIGAFRRLAKFAPYVAGSSFTIADCTAFVHLPLIAMTTRAVAGRDMLQAGGVPWRDYVKLVGARPAARRIIADQRALSSRRDELLKAH